MSERGVFAVDRGVWEHPIFADEPFTEREAWLWMVSAAVWTAKRVRVGRATVDLQRGQLAFATRFLAERWKWAHSKVVRFLKRLETDTMVTTLATRETTLITICNYDQYQFGRNTNETQTGTQTDTPPERPRNKEEELNKRNAAPAALDPEAELFRRGREVLGKQAGGLISRLLTAKQKNIALARAAIEQASTKSDPREYIGAVLRGPQQQQQPNWLDGIEGVI